MNLRKKKILESNLIYPVDIFSLGGETSYGSFAKKQ